MAAKSTTRQKITIETESTYGTDPASSPIQVRVVEGSFEAASAAQQSVTPAVVRADFYETEAPETFDRVVDGAVKLAVHIRDGSAIATEVPLTKLLEAAGCPEAVGANTTISAGGAVGLYVLASAASWAEGEAVLLGLSSGANYYPSLIADLSTATVTPGMDAPSDPSSCTALAMRTFRIDPHNQGVDGTICPSLTVTQVTDADAGTARKWTACTVQSIDAVELTHGVPPVFTFTARGIPKGVSNVTISDDAYLETAKLALVDDRFRCEFAAADSAGGITYATTPIYAASVTTGAGTSTIAAIGSATGVAGGTAGARFVPGTVRVSLTLDYDRDWITRWEADAPTYWYIGLVQPTADPTNRIPFAFWAPRCRLVQAPEEQYKDTPEHRMVLTFEALPTQYSTTMSDAVNAPLTFAFGGKAS